ncbi:MAG TPA: hypothetical protein VGD88_05840 [Opitutaceae bacterium]
MKIDRLFLSLAALASVLPISAAPLAQASAVYSRPDTTAAVLTQLPAGTEPVTAVTGYGILPAGWIAVTLAGPHEVFVQNKDITKSLDVAPGAPMHKEPKIESAVITTAAQGDVTEIIGLRGRWTHLLLNKALVGYVQVSGAAPALAATTPAATTPAPATTAPAPAAYSPAPVASTPAQTNAPLAAAPVPVAARGTHTNPGQAAPMVNLGDGGASSLPRGFQGRFVSTRNPLRPRRPYDYQLTDERGERYAYLDTSKLLLTEQIDNYLNRTVAIYGAAKPVPGTRDIVIEVESLQLR